MIKLVQDKRDNTRSQALPSLDGQTSRRKKQPGKKSQRSLNQDDMLEALQKLQTRSEEIFGKRGSTPQPPKFPSGCWRPLLAGMQNT